jgi:hypothetical protein
VLAISPDSDKMLEKTVFSSFSERSAGASSEPKAAGSTPAGRIDAINLP